VDNEDKLGLCNFEHSLVVERIRLGWHESGRSLADVGLSSPDGQSQESAHSFCIVPRSFSWLVEIRSVCRKNFERWKALADLTSKERDPEKLTQLARLTQKTPDLDPPLREPLE
jgi:hypothetical protein